MCSSVSVAKYVQIDVKCSFAKKERVGLEKQEAKVRFGAEAVRSKRRKSVCGVTCGERVQFAGRGLTLQRGSKR